MNDQQSAAFHLEEYKSLRQEIDVRIRELNTLSIYCVTGQLATFAFLITIAFRNTHHDDNWWSFFSIALFPFIFPMYGLLKATELKKVVERISRYVRTVENVYRVPSLTGWENSIEGARSNSYKLQEFFYGMKYWPLWIGMILLEVLFLSWIYYFRPGFGNPIVGD